MIRTTRAIFCDQDHGNGDVMFPELDYAERLETHQEFINPRSIRQLREDAKKVGWKRIKGLDYCPTCAESE